MKKKSSQSLRLLLVVIRFKNYVIANYKSIRKHLFSIFIFILISSAFWYYRALDDIYVASVKYPIKYINLPLNKIFSGNPPKEIVLRVRGKGFTILSNRINAPTLNLDINDFSMYSQSKDSFRVYMLSRYAHEWFLTELSNKNTEHLEILDISPDTIAFNFTRLSYKKLPVIPVFSNNKELFSRQHMLNGKILVVPDSIVAYGPANLLDTMCCLSTHPLRISGLTDTITKKIGINEISDIKLTTNKVKVSIPVDRYTESTVEVPIAVKNAPDSISIKLFPRTAKITYKVTLSQYNLGKNEDFYPYVNYLDINNKIGGDNLKLRVYLDTFPFYAHSVNKYPSDVEFLIEVKNVKGRTDRGNR